MRVHVPVAVVVRLAAARMDVIVAVLVIVAVIEIGMTVIVRVGGAVGVHVQVRMFGRGVVHHGRFGHQRRLRLRASAVRS